MSHFRPRLLLDCQNIVGEGPTWIHPDRLVWVDLGRDEVHSYRLHSGAHEVWRPGELVSAIVPCLGGGFLLACKGSLKRARRWGAELEPEVEVSHGPGEFRLNDGKCDPAGAFWVGSLALGGEQFSAALYRYSTGGSAERVIAEVGLSNGLGWSPDGSEMYFVDTDAASVECWSNWSDSDLRVRRTLISIDPADGLADGLCVDSDGFLWLAMWEGAAIRRYRPDGPLDCIIDLPVSRVTSCCFGGADMRDLFITTASVVTGSEPGAGGLWHLRVDVPGLPPTRFGGPQA